MVKLFYLLLIASSLNALSWMILTPLWQYPDEQAHFAQVQDLAELGGVPAESFNTSYEIAISEEILETKRDTFGNNNFTYHPQHKISYSNNIYGPKEIELANLNKSERTNLVKIEATENPPLYYALGSLSYKMFYDYSLFSRVYAVRIMSALIFIMTIVLAYRIGKTVFAEEKLLILAIPALVAFKPMLVHSSTGILPDALTNLLFTAILLFSLKILTTGIKTNNILPALILVIVGVFTRQQFLISLSVIFTAIFFQVIKKKTYALYSGIFFILIAVFIYLVNFRWTSVPIINYFRIPDLKIFNPSLFFEKSFIDYLKWSTNHTIAEILPWYWGVYKWLSLTIPHITYQVINRIVILSLIGIVLRYVIVFRKKKFSQQDRILTFFIIISTIYYAIFTAWNYLFIASHNFPFGFQGRYFFPLVVAHISILLIGIWEIAQIILRQKGKYAILLLVFLMILFNSTSLFTVASSYYDTSSLPVFIAQASQYKPELFKGNVIALVLTLALLTQAAFIFRFAKYIIKNNETSRRNRR